MEGISKPLLFFFFSLSFLFLFPSLSLSTSAIPCGCDSPSTIYKTPINLYQKERRSQPTMVYASVPAYLDPPNWNQQHQIHQAGGSSTGGGGGTGGSDAHQLLIPPVPPARPEGDQNMSGSVRPGSMADRARHAKVPQPEPSLKCPRCDSSNTKFCYFNNYSLSQPRHFCKTCRRYWTRGGALRNVPVGGGCRRNKRSKSSGSKSSTSNSHTTGSSVSGTTSTSAGAIGPQISAPTQYPFLPQLNPLLGYGSTNIGLSYGGLQTINDPVDHYQVGGNSSGSAGLDQWRFQQLQHFPFFAGLEQQTSAPPSLGLYSFDTDVNVQGTAVFGGGEDHGKVTAAGLISQLASVKMEESQQSLNRSTQYLGITTGGNDHQYWANSGGGGGSSTAGGGIGNSNTGNGGWTMDLSGFSSSSAGNLI